MILEMKESWRDDPGSVWFLGAEGTIPVVYGS